MQQNAKAEFEAQVLQALDEMEVELALQGGTDARRDYGSNQDGKESRGRVALKKAATLLKDNKILNIICPGLRDVSEDVREFAKWVTPAIFPLTVDGTIPLDPLVFSGIAVLIMHFGVDVVCRDPDKKIGTEGKD